MIRAQGGMVMADKDSSSLTEIISTAMKIPGIRVDRNAFLREQFKEQDPVALKSISKDNE